MLSLKSHYQLTAITNAARHSQWVFFIQSCRQIRMFIFSGHLYRICKHKQLNGLYFTMLLK